MRHWPVSHTRWERWTTVPPMLVSESQRPAAGDGGRGAHTPEGLSAPLLFQYSQGVSFVAEAYVAAAGQPSMPLPQSASIEPPGSASGALLRQQFAGTAKISLAGYERIMGGWKKVDDDTYGELLIRIILERNLGKESNEIGLAARWVADRMIVLQQSNGVNVIWMWRSATRSREPLRRRIPDSARPPARRSTVHRIDTRQQRAGRHRTGCRLLHDLAPAIWNATTIESGGVTARIEPPAASAAQ